MKTGMNTVLRKIQKQDLDDNKFCTIFEDMTPFSLSKSYVGSVQDFEEIASHFFQGFATKLPPGTYIVILYAPEIGKIFEVKYSLIRDPIINIIDEDLKDGTL